MPRVREINPSSTLEAAAAYAELGLSVIPISRRMKLPDNAALASSGNFTRRKVASWKALQTRSPRPEELACWFGQWELNIGIVTGFKDCYALDFDIEDCYHLWASHQPNAAATLPTQKTNRGYHVLFRMKQLRSTRHRIFLPLHLVGVPNEPKVASFLGMGTWMTAWPSVHPRGSIYHWLEGRSPWDLGIPEVASMDALGLRIDRQRVRVWPFFLRCLTHPKVASQQLRYYYRRANGLVTDCNRGG